MKLNEKILYYRRRAKLSQEELAAAVGVSRQAVSKWELGDATPEVDKLLALARAFGVTADELLSEEEPSQSGPEPEQEPRTEGPQPYSYGQGGGAPSDALDRLPGFLIRLIRRYGWLAGVYVALSGLGLAFVGGLARFLFGRMFRISLDAFNGMGGFGGMGGVTIEGAENLPPEVVDQIIGELGGGTGSLGGVSVVSDMGRLFQGFATAILVAGVVVLIVGIALAVWLYRRGRNDD